MRGMLTALRPVITPVEAIQQSAVQKGGSQALYECTP